MGKSACYSSIRTWVQSAALMMSATMFKKKKNKNPAARDDYICLKPQCCSRQAEEVCWGLLAARPAPHSVTWCQRYRVTPTELINMKFENVSSLNVNWLGLETYYNIIMITTIPKANEKSLFKKQCGNWRGGSVVNSMCYSRGSKFGSYYTHKL